MDDLQEPLHLHEQFLFQLMQNVLSLKYSVDAIKAYLLTNSPEPNETLELLNAVEEVAADIDPLKDRRDQMQAYIATGLIKKPSLYSDSLVKRNILRPTCCLCVCVTDDQNDWPDTALTIWSKE